MAEVAYCPAVQSAQSVLAATLLNLPTGQSEQETEPLAAENTYFPGTQLVQAVAPVVLVPVAPAGQASQELCEDLLYVLQWHVKTGLAGL